MKTESKIILGSVALGLFIWIADALLDYFFFYEGTLKGLLLTDVSSHELYIRLLIMACFTVFGVICSRLVAKLKKALDEVKTLSGFLPICASCKKIRDDKGYWNQVETYIEKHSSAQFSHAMCEECSDRMYGGQDWYEKAKKDRSIKSS